MDKASDEVPLCYSLSSVATSVVCDDLFYLLVSAFLHKIGENS